MVAHSLQGPWLNFDEVTQKTGLVKNEILYAIQTQRITPVIYTTLRPFLAYSTTPQGQLIGHAHFQYSGTLAIQQEAIQEIVVNDQTILGREPVRILCPEHIRGCKSDYGFKETLPNGLLDSWEAGARPFDDHVATMMQPYEYRSYDDAETGIIEYIPSYYDEDAFFADYGDRYFVRSPHSHSVYGSHYSHVYDQKALRFPIESIDRLVNPQMTPSKTKPLRLRRTELHNVISRTIEEYPTAQSGILWNALRKDIQQENRLYDKDCIITAMSHAEIHWENLAGKVQILKRRSFENRVSQLKKVGNA